MLFETPSKCAPSIRGEANRERVMHAAMRSKCNASFSLMQNSQGLLHAQFFGFSV